MQEFMEFIQQNMIWALLWVGLLLALIVTTIKEKTAGYKTLTPQEAITLVNRQNGLFVDVRARDKFRTSHIAESLNVAAKTIKDSDFFELEKHKANPLILVCDKGLTAAECANLLAKAGFEQLYVLKDGLISWNEANLPLVRNKKK